MILPICPVESGKIPSYYKLLINYFSRPLVVIETGLRHKMCVRDENMREMCWKIEKGGPRTNESHQRVLLIKWKKRNPREFQNSNNVSH